MKKASASFAVIFFACIGYACAADIVADSRINAVTVFPDSALISRVGEVKVTPGPQKVVFSDIIPEVDENSLRVSGDGTAKVLILGAQVKREFLEEEAAQRVKELQDQVQELEDQRAMLEDSRKALSDERQLLDSFRVFAGQQVPKDLITKMPAVKELDDLVTYVRGKYKDNYGQGMELTVKSRELEKKLSAVRNELASLGGGSGRKMKRSIVVDLDVQSAGSLDLAVTYLVAGASWQPVYDARAQFAASQVELISQAVVSQRTGEDWKGVEVSLSTAKPNLEGRLPYVAPWFIRPAQPVSYEMEDKMVRRKDMMRQTMAYNAQALDEGLVGGAMPAAAPAKKEQAEYRYAQAQEKGLSVVYKLTGKADIKADGSEQKLPVSRQALKADFKYSAYPRLSPFAYLGSRVTNSQEMQLLAGRVNVFLDGDYVGSSGIDNVGMGEEFDLYMGVDENVKVKREEVEKKTDNVLIAGIPSPTRKVTYKYKLTAENYKNRNAKVILFEAVPVSQDERIKVNIGPVSLQPLEKDWKDRKGVWRWELDLAPKQKQEITYVYTVECPRDMQVEGL